MRDPETIDEGRQAKLRKEEDLAARLAVADLEAVLGTPEGRRVLYRVLEMCGVGVVNTDAERYDNFKRFDSHASACAVGEQNVGNRLMADWLSQAPGLFRTMIDEAAKRIAEGIQRSRLEAARAQQAESVERDGEDEEEND